MADLQKQIVDLSNALINEQEDKKEYQTRYESIQEEGRRLFTTYVAKANRLKEVRKKEAFIVPYTFDIEYSSFWISTVQRMRNSK